jgi:hypothetical protein
VGRGCSWNRYRPCGEMRTMYILNFSSKFLPKCLYIIIFCKNLQRDNPTTSEFTTATPAVFQSR